MFIRKTIFISFILIFVGSLSVSGPKERSRQANDKQETFLVPSEIAMPVLAYQPESPLEVQFLQVRGYVTGGVNARVRFRNRSMKSIRSYTIAWVSRGGVGEEWSSPKTDIKPGELVPEKGVPPSDGIAFPTDKQKKELNLDEMLGQYVFIVVRAELDDGTVFDAGKAYEALKSYFEKIDPALRKPRN